MVVLPVVSDVLEDGEGFVVAAFGGGFVVDWVTYEFVDFDDSFDAGDVGFGEFREFSVHG